MNLDDRQNDPLMAAVAGLRTYDVSERHAQRLRSRCHVRLRGEPRRNASVRMRAGTLFRRVIAPALGGAWCLAYLVEIIRRAAMAYGF
jgi:hypothetical protein